MLILPIIDRLPPTVGGVLDDRLLRLAGPLPPPHDWLRLCQGRRGQGWLPGRSGCQVWLQYFCCWDPRTLCGNHYVRHSSLI